VNLRRVILLSKRKCGVLCPMIHYSLFIVRSDDLLHPVSVQCSFTLPLYGCIILLHAYCKCKEFWSNSYGTCGIRHSTAARQYSSYVCNNIPADRHRIRSFPQSHTARVQQKKWYTAWSPHFVRQGPQECKSSDLTLVILKCPNAKSFIFKKSERKTIFIKFKLSNGTIQTSYLCTGIIKTLSLSRETLPLRLLKIFRDKRLRRHLW
jgi:hypothetical protein